MEYSLDSYRLIIDKARETGYRFVPFSLQDQPEPGSIYLRHDVDYSLPLALELARVNAEMKVAGTFFVLLRSHAYNLLSSSSREIVRKIHELGQHIALHVVIDPSAPDEIESRLAADFDFTRREFPFLSAVFSWHNPTPEALAGTSSRDEVAGLINVYSSRFTRAVIYRSDSNMRVSPEEFLSLAGALQDQALQLLFHPLIWVIGGERMGLALAGAWPSLIKEQEQEMLENKIYRELLPDGMPASVSKNFTELLRAAMEN
jgi:hypothetical protein